MMTDAVLLSVIFSILGNNKTNNYLFIDSN